MWESASLHVGQHLLQKNAGMSEAAREFPPPPQTPIHAPLPAVPVNHTMQNGCCALYFKTKKQPGGLIEGQGWTLRLFSHLAEMKQFCNHMNV